jgi:histidinol-phosphate aminotransferase
LKNMFAFLRPDLAHLQAYNPAHPSGNTLDRLDGNESYLDLPPELKQKLAWTYQEIIATNRYPDGGHGELKEAIAAYVNTYTLNSPNSSQPRITPEYISVGNGSDELIRSILIATCLGGSGSILVAEPTFSMYGITAETLGIPVQKIPRHNQDWSMDLEAADQTIAAQEQSPVRIVFVVHPNSPTGNALTPAEINWLRGLPENILVVIDEAYFEYCQQSLVGELVDRPNWLIMRTFSKAMRLAAHRVGYAIAHPQIIETLEKIRLPYNLPSLSQAAALLALHHRDELLSVVEQVITQRQSLIEELTTQPDLKKFFRVWSSAANFIYLRLQNEQNVDSSQILARIIHEMQAQGTLIRHTGGGLRITIGSPEENQRTLTRLAKVVDRLS